MIARARRLATLGLALMLLAIHPAAAQGLAQSLNEDLTEGLTEAIAERLDLTATAADDGQAGIEAAALRQFYAEREFQPLWVGPGGPTVKARLAAKALSEADLDGLDPRHYGAEIIAQRLGAQGLGGQDPDAQGLGAQEPDADTPEALAAIEVMLSRGVYRFAADQKAGRLVPNDIDREFQIHPERPTVAEVLGGAAATGDIAAYLAGFAPQTPNYSRLKQALAAYREIEAAGGWSRIPEGESLKPGMSDPRVPALRQRLIEAGDLASDVVVPTTDALIYDPVLEAAVKRFQWRHGLAQDGVVGRKTIAAMNVPVAERLDQMLLNMERRRWMPDDLGRRYVFVNMADFELKVVDGPKTVFDTRVVVGTPYHRTPVFSGTMTYVVLNPYWNITPTIARNEILPKLRQDPGYLAAHDIEVLSDWSEGAVPVDPATVDWSGLRSLPYKLRQRPGPQNALGRIKFMFPNPYNIYLHDTPARDLFERTVRSFSHGCIRVQHPVELAAVLLGPDGWTKERLDAAIATGQQKVVTLGQPIPVHLTYLTAWVNKDGSVHFRDDIYGRDATLADALLPPRQGI